VVEVGVMLEEVVEVVFDQEHLLFLLEHIISKLVLVEPELMEQVLMEEILVLLLPSFHVEVEEVEEAGLLVVMEVLVVVLVEIIPQEQELQGREIMRGVELGVPLSMPVEEEEVQDK
jgi:hypothetical protein